MTLTILAADIEAGLLAVASCSAMFDVTRTTVRAAPGSGIAVSQHLPWPAFLDTALARLPDAAPPSIWINEVLTDVPSSAHRQFAVLDARGRVALHVGAQCTGAAGARVRGSTIVLGAFLTSEAVLDATMDAYLEARGPFPARLLDALDAGIRTGGDARGECSAGLHVVPTHGAGPPAAEAYALHVASDATPVATLRQQWEARGAHSAAWEAFNRGVAGDLDGALRAFEEPTLARSRIPQVRVLHAVLLCHAGRRGSAQDQLADTLRISPPEFLRHLAAAGFIP